jgi:starvation-inducible DNA-binding protein
MHKHNFESSSQASIVFMAGLLTGEYLLYSKTREVHWKMYGQYSDSYCPFFEKQFSELAQIIDSVADCMPKTAGYTYAVSDPFPESENVSVSKYSNNSYGHIQELLHGHENIIRILRDYIVAVSGSQWKLANYELLQILIGKHEKMAASLDSGLATRYSYDPKPIIVCSATYVNPEENYAYAF